MSPRGAVTLAVALVAGLVAAAVGSASPLAAGSPWPADPPSPVPVPPILVRDATVVVDDPAVRVTVRGEERETVMRAQVTLRGSDVLPLGHTRIDEVGVDGARHEIVEVILHDGVPVDERVVAVAERPPSLTVMSIGTATSSAAAKDWAALARCESGGDPTIVSASGRYHGLYQFDLPTWESVGGTGRPSEASPDEQQRRAIALYEQRGASPWPTCGRHL